MCVFSQDVESVSGTRIYARRLEGSRQLLVYDMNLETRTDVAMVLPLPVAAANGGASAGVEFVNLESFPEFFEVLRQLFPRPWARGRDSDVRYASEERLEVVTVGSFEASWVPTVGDFSRLDERFRIPPGLLDAVPQYGDWGFAVFRLKPGAYRVHPLALTFATRFPEALFFPTVHVHEGRWHEEAAFDHALYVQPGEGTEAAHLHPAAWEQSSLSVDGATAARSQSCLHPGPVFRARISGVGPNRDVFVDPERDGAAEIIAAVSATASELWARTREEARRRSEQWVAKGRCFQCDKWTYLLQREDLSCDCGGSLFDLRDRAGAPIEPVSRGE